MACYKCLVCGYVYDEGEEGRKWGELPEDWTCPACGAARSSFESSGEEAAEPHGAAPARASDDLEAHMAAIHRMATTGRSIIEPMRTHKPCLGWDEILIRGAQLARVPLNEDQPVRTETILGPNADRPLVIDTPVYVSHMSFGALSREAKLALAKGSAAVRTAMCSGEGGILEESIQSACKYIFEYVPNRYSVTEENLRRADAVEIKFGQSSKPGMGGHLPGEKVTAEIAAVRGRPQGADITSPAGFDDIRTPDDVRRKVDWLREKSAGRPVGIKIAAGHVEADLEVALFARPDFITIDGRPGGTGASPKLVKDATSIPTVFALWRARKYLDQHAADGVSLVITGGLRVSSDVAKALALGADAVALASAALMAIGCRQYRVCHTGRCPMGVTTQDPELRRRLDVSESARRLENFLRVTTEELATFARLTGHDDVHKLSVGDLCTISSEISGHTGIEHA